MERERIASDAATGAPAPRRSAKLVLIVDDDPSIAEAVAAVVELVEYEAVIAHNGKQALERAQQRWPAMIISDIMMPVMDGHKLVVALRAQAEHWHLPMPVMVLMTAASEHTVDGLMVDVVVSKPFEIAVIEAVLHRFLRDAD